MVKKAKAPPKVNYKAILAERARQKKEKLLAEIDEHIARVNAEHEAYSREHHPELWKDR